MSTADHSSSSAVEYFKALLEATKKEEEEEEREEQEEENGAKEQHEGEEKDFPLFSSGLGADFRNAGGGFGAERGDRRNVSLPALWESWAGNSGSGRSSSDISGSLLPLDNKKVHSPWDDSR